MLLLVAYFLPKIIIAKKKMNANFRPIYSGNAAQIKTHSPCQ